MTTRSCTALSRTTLLSHALDSRPLLDPPSDPRLRAGDGAPDRDAAVDAHIQRCRSCRRLVQRLRGSLAALRTRGRTTGRTTRLRGRILGAAHDRAWSELGRRLAGLLETARENARRGDGSGDARWRRQRAGVSALARRLEGLGIHVDLSDLPTRRPSPTTLPRVLRHLGELLELVGHGDGAPDHRWREDYQPSAAPSFLDSLPPL